MIYELEEQLRYNFHTEEINQFGNMYSIPLKLKKYFLHGLFDFLDENNIIYAKSDVEIMHPSNIRIQQILNMSFFRDVNNSFLEIGRTLGYLIQQEIKDEEQIIFYDFVYKDTIYQEMNQMMFPQNYYINIIPMFSITKKQEFNFHNSNSF